MFSGIVEETAQVVAIEHDKDNIHITMKIGIHSQLQPCEKLWNVPTWGC